MYSCNPEHPNQKFSADTSKERLCRFDKRFDKEHEQLGCKSCKRGWDTDYLRSQGLLKHG